MAGIQNGADAIELDVWISADDKIVVSHRDTNLPEDYMYASLVSVNKGETPLVKDYKVADQDKYLIKEAWVHQKAAKKTYLSDKFTTPADPHMHLPLFSDILDAVCPTGKKIVVDLKGNNNTIAPRVIQLLETKNLFSCIHTITTFQWTKFQNPDYFPVTDHLEPVRFETRLTRSLLFNKYPQNDADLIHAAEYYNVSEFHPSCVLFDNNTEWGHSFVQLAHNTGRRVSCYYGSDIDKEDLLKDKLQYGLDELCTNNPDILSRLVSSSPSPSVHPVAPSYKKTPRKSFHPLQ